AVAAPCPQAGPGARRGLRTVVRSRLGWQADGYARRGRLVLLLPDQEPRGVRGWRVTRDQLGRGRSCGAHAAQPRFRKAIEQRIAWLQHPFGLLAGGDPAVEAVARTPLEPAAPRRGCVLRRTPLAGGRRRRARRGR